MKKTTRSIEQIIEEQIRRWKILHEEKTEKKSTVPTITLSREPGSGGRIVAQRLAERLGFEVFYREVLHEIAKGAEVSEQVLATLDEMGLSILEDWISSLVYDRHLWPDEYLKHLMKVIGAIGKHGRAIIVGRGANFILPPDQRLRVRIIAPQKLRIQNIARDFNLSKDAAKRRVIKTESNRKAFIRKYFNADITDPNNYDLVINTEILSVSNVTDLIAAALGYLVNGGNL
jgi:cytidylate kinase